MHGSQCAVQRVHFPLGGREQTHSWIRYMEGKKNVVSVSGQSVPDRHLGVLHLMDKMTLLSQNELN